MENKQMKCIKGESCLHCGSNYCRFVDELDQLKKTNEELKKENEEFKKQVCCLRPELKFMIDKTCSKYNIEAKYYHEKIVEIINNLDKLSKTLVEIKEICNSVENIENINSLYDAKLSGMYLQAHKILQKISEVENANI